jgi:hypothetical protein
MGDAGAKIKTKSHKPSINGMYMEAIENAGGGF